MKRKDDLYPPILGRGGRGPVTHIDARAIPKAGIFQYKDSLVEELIPFLPPGPEGPEGPQGPVGPPGEDGLTPYIGDNGNWWIGSIDTGVKAQGPDGPPGREIELRVTDTHIQWRYVGASTWTNLIALSELKGRDGEDGRELEITKSPTHILWRYVGESSWTELIPLEEIKGRDGEDGREIEIQKGLDTIQWRWLGDDTWKDLVTLEELKGEDGKDGEDGLTPYIGDNGNWWIGDTDTGIPAQGPQGPQGDPGNTPYIGANGNWWIGEVDTGHPATGPKGDKGDPGEKWFSGSTAPSGTLGSIGDWYLNTSNGNVYEKTASNTWTQRGNIRGPQGTQGPKGDDGITPTISPVTETWWLGPVDTGFPARGPKGDKGDDGLTPELRQGQDAIEWRYLGEINWTPLVPLIDITGPQGPPGPNNAIRAGYSHMGGGVYQIIDGDDDFEQEAFPEGDGVRIKWKTNRNNPAVFVIPGRAENGKPMMSVLEEEVGSDSCLVTFETVDGPAYPTKFLVTVIGEEE